METIIARIKEKIFLLIAVCLPKYLISSGNVAIPTIIKVEIKIAIWGYPAPASINDAAKGKATKPGIKVMQPIVPLITMPTIPKLVPINLDYSFRI